MEILFFIALLVVTCVTGAMVEKRHYASIRQREAEIRKIPVISTEKELPLAPQMRCEMATGSVVVGADYFRYMLANLINIFGGRIGVFENLLDRGRREAMLRLRQDASAADFISNVRYELCILSENSKQLPALEVLVYGTAIYLPQDAQSVGNAVQAHGV